MGKTVGQKSGATFPLIGGMKDTAGKTEEKPICMAAGRTGA
jgi:hypothetical protein